MSSHDLGAKELVIGAAIGGVIATVATLLLAPKSGKRIRRDVSDLCEDLADSACSQAAKLSKTGKCFRNHFQDNACHWGDKINSLWNGIHDSLPENTSPNQVRDFAIGAVVGSLLGATVGLISARQPGDEFRDGVMEHYHDFADKAQDYANQFHKNGKKFAKKARSNTCKWLDMAKHFVDDLTEEGEELTEQLAEKVKDYGNVGQDKLSQALEWASLGIKVWNQLNRR